MKITRNQPIAAARRLWNTCACALAVLGAVASAPVSAGRPAPDQITSVPRVSGSFIPTFTPTYPGKPGAGGYMNDHTIIRDKVGQWHLIGISGYGSGGEFSFAHGVAPSVNGPWTQLPDVAAWKHPDGRLMEAWAPYAMWAGDTAYLFYRSDIANGGALALDTSTDPSLRVWNRRLDVNLKHPDGRPYIHVRSMFRDVMVVPDGSIYRMYFSDFVEGRSAIGMATSSNLIDWVYQGVAFTVSGSATDVGWGAAESPFVIKRGNQWYLSVTLTTSNPANYHQTLIFRSGNPAWFGNFDGSKPSGPGANFVTELNVHAPEYILGDGGQWYITTCGWAGMSAYPAGKSGAAISWMNWDDSPASGSTLTAIPQNGLIARYRFEQSSGVEVTDFSGTGRTAYLHGAATFAGQSRGQGLTVGRPVPGDKSMFSPNGALLLPHMNFTGDFSVGGWVLTPGNVDNTAGLLVTGDSRADINFYGGYPRLYADNADRAVSSQPVTPNTWNHLMVTRQSGTVRIYLNGNLTATSPGVWNGAFWPVQIGRTIAGPARGSYDELAFYVRALTQAEIRSMMWAW